MKNQHSEPNVPETVDGECGCSSSPTDVVASSFKSKALEDWPGVSEVKYEYLDHTADVQLHTWGDNLQEAFEQCAIAMFAYMTDIDTVEPCYSYDIEASGHDLLSLLFHFLDEWSVKIMDWDLSNFQVKARGWGESFDLKKHPQGTEVKAITYSNMQIHDEFEKPELFVIIDI